ncbi:MAG: imidazole glycerol phosphate synthase subunit HisH [Deltaproteobacteria bacterium]|nr:imidazole glycerol phosphate synthase subunit HisH [Deltaproteobacteria bacterium]MCL5791482.1 imidazole glycerol phosphate synthase subunit HisH [Deltaproteobacteria bacterium]
MITIVDYGMGNLRSVEKAIASFGTKVIISKDPDQISNADKLILPGVGAFGDGMINIRSYGIEQAIKDFVKTGKLMLGICLGMQMLFEECDENPGVQGLGLIKGGVKGFKQAGIKSQGLKVPHIGWNSVEQVKYSFIFEGIKDKSYFYFVHSYYPAPLEDVTIGNTGYGIAFTSVVQRDNVIATQFHPEKSQQNGLSMLSNFIKFRG